MPRTLVIDDEPDIRTVLSRGLPLLLGGGSEVKTAGSIEEARRILAQEAFDVVVCDHRLAGGIAARDQTTGLEFLTRLRQEGHPAKRILLTAFDEAVFPSAALDAAGLAAVCTKPVSLAKLAELLRATAGPTPAAPAARTGA